MIYWFCSKWKFWVGVRLLSKLKRSNFRWNLRQKRIDKMFTPSQSRNWIRKWKDHKSDNRQTIEIGTPSIRQSYLQTFDENNNKTSIANCHHTISSYHFFIHLLFDRVSFTCKRNNNKIAPIEDLCDRWS